MATVTKYKLTRAEREVTINWDMEDNIARIDSSNPVIIRKLDKLCLSNPDVYTCIRVDEKFGAKEYRVPAKYISFRKPRPAGKNPFGNRTRQIGHSDDLNPSS